MAILWSGAHDLETMADRWMKSIVSIQKKNNYFPHSMEMRVALKLVEIPKKPTEVGEPSLRSLKNQTTKNQSAKLH